MRAKSHSNGRPPGTGVPRKWQWHYNALGRLRDHLVDDLCVQLAQTAKPIEPPSLDAADSATDESDRTLAVSLLSGEKNALQEVETAMQRILEGTYGICEKSGKRIPLQRLRAVPWTRFTKEAEDEIEKEGRTSGPDETPTGSTRNAGGERPTGRRTKFAKE
jgi:RNA polymerase-binding transcription factor DksA